MKNPFAQAVKLVQLTLQGSAALQDAVETLVEDEALALTRMTEAVSPHLIIIADATKETLLKNLCEQAAAQHKEALQLRVLHLEPIDWVKKIQKDFPPFRLGPFYVYGSHAKDTVPDDALPLLIEAAAAFGTGEHETTACCLLALAAEKKKRKRARHVLDMGCGTAILAIGAARLWPQATITACDNDAVAVEVSRQNLAANHVRGRVFRSDGYKDRRVRMIGVHREASSPRRGEEGYDLIVANILARPLMMMGKDAAKHLVPGGTLILSGLLVRQESMVLSAYRMQGLRLQSRIRRGRWSALILSA